MTNEELNELVKQHIQWEYDPTVHNLTVGETVQKEVEDMTGKEKEEFFNSPDFYWSYNPEIKRKSGLPIKPLKESNVTISQSSVRVKCEDSVDTRRTEDFIDDSDLYTTFDDSSTSDCNDYDSSFYCSCDY